VERGDNKKQIRNGRMGARGRGEGRGKEKGKRGIKESNASDSVLSPSPFISFKETITIQ